MSGSIVKTFHWLLRFWRKIPNNYFIDDLIKYTKKVLKRLLDDFFVLLSVLGVYQ
jgi:hypothetical protein